MSVSFAAVPWLWALLPALAVVAVGLRLARRHSRRWRWVCLIAPGLAAILLILGLARPAVIRSPLAHDIVVLLDQSPSARVSPWRDPAWVRTLLAYHLLPQSTDTPAALPRSAASPIRITVLGFGNTVRVLAQNLPLADPQAWPAAWPDTSGSEGPGDLRSALLWQPATAPLTTDRRPRWLITDGLLDFTSVEDIRTRYPLAVTIVPPTQVNVGVADLEVRSLPAPAAPPTTARAATSPTAGTPVEIWARLQATGPALVTVQILRDGQLLAERPASFTVPSSRTISVVDPRGPASPPSATSPSSTTANIPAATRYEVRLITSDPWPEDNSAAILVPTPGPPSILVVTTQPDAFRAAWSPGSAAGALRIVRPEDMPVDLAAPDSATRQIILLDNIPRDQLRPGAEDYLDHWVKDLAGGLLITGSTRAFGPGGYANTPLDDLSPLASTPPKRPPYRFIFLLDSSGSMAEPGPRGGTKFAYAAQAAQDATTALKPDDDILILGFNSTIRELARGTKEQLNATLHNRLEKVAPNGPTVPDSALGTLERDLGNQGQRTLIILLTDGEITNMDVPRWTKLLKDSHAKLAIIAPAAHSAQEMLPRLAAAIGPAQAIWLTADHPEAWPRLMKQAVEEPLIGQAHTQPLDWHFASPDSSVPAIAPGSPPAGETRAWIETWAKPAVGLRAVGTAPDHPPVESLRVEQQPVPLAAIWQRGLGKVAAVPFDAPEANFATLLRNLIGDLAPPAGDRRFTVTLDRNAAPPDSGRWRVRAQGLDETRFLDHETLRLHIFLPDAPPRDIPMPQVGPGSYEALLPPDIELFSGIVVRTPASSPGEPTPGDQLVARLNPPRLPGREWPATAIPATPPVWAMLLNPIPALSAATSSAAAAPSPTWQPHELERRWELTPWLWPLAIAVLLAALWARRGK